MGLMDKMKHILFDEEEILVDEPKKVKKEVEPVKETRISRSGFVDHSGVSEDTITEIKLPKEEVVREPVKEETKSFGFTLDLDNYEPVREKKVEEPPVQKPVYRNPYGSARSEYTQRENPIHNKYMVDKKPETKYQAKDYKQIINSPLRKEKKPFSVTPVISPVYGIIDEDYIKENGKKIEAEKVEETPEIFGPVSYIEDILPKKTLKKEVEPEIKDEIEVKEVVEEIVTPDYDKYEEIHTSGIENEYIGNNTIEDAFEPTSEYESGFSSSYVSEITETEKKENEALADTIETDLFNLIDSMYKDDEED